MQIDEPCPHVLSLLCERYTIAHETCPGGYTGSVERRLTGDPELFVEHLVLHFERPVERCAHLVL